MSKDGASDNAASNQPSADSAKNAELYENRETKKIVRVITVLAYMFSVSFVGIALSGYYLFIWTPPNPRLLHDELQHRLEADPQAEAFVADESISMVPVKRSRSVFGRGIFDKVSFVADEPQVPSSGDVDSRREILNNVNMVLRNKFSRTEFNSSTDSNQENSTDIIDSEFSAVNVNTNSAVENDTFSDLENVTESTAEFRNNKTSTSIIFLLKKEAESSTASTSTTGSYLPSTTRKVVLRRKPHQTPFALKHLTIPIQTESRRRSSRISSTRKSNGSQSAKGFELEKPTISTSTTLEPEAFEESERVVSPQSNNVWKMLTESAMLRTSFPSASLSPSDSLNSEIQRVPEVNDYYKRLSTSETNAEN